MDLIFEFTNQMDEEGVNYILVTLRKGEEMHEADAFINLEDEEATRLIFAAFGEIAEKIEKGESFEEGNEVDLSVPMKKKKKNVPKNISKKVQKPPTKENKQKDEEWNKNPFLGKPSRKKKDKEE